MDDKTYPLKTRARFVFMFWALYAAPAIYSLQYVRPKLIIFGDAAATVKNIMTNEFLFRTGIVSHLVAQVFLLLFGMAVLRLFRGVNKTWSRIFWTSIVTAAAITVVNTLNSVAPLLLLGNADYPGNFQPEELQAFAMFFLRLSNYGQALFEIFWGLYLVAFGMLLLKSRFIPGILGVMMIVGGAGFPVNTFTKLLVPEFHPALFTQMTMLASGLGVVPALFWLWIVGARERQPDTARNPG